MEKFIVHDFDGHKNVSVYCDVGDILQFSEYSLDDYSGHAKINTPECEFEVMGRAPFVVYTGCVLYMNRAVPVSVRLSPDYPKEYCNDPRVLYMYLMSVYQSCHGLPEVIPPVPTRKEAETWLKKAGIPLEPAPDNREISLKTKRFLLNQKV